MRSWCRALSRCFRKLRKTHLPIARLRLEELENRLVPAAIVWTGNGDGTTWAQAANWNLNRVPATDDDVSIPDVARTTEVLFNTTVSVKTVVANEAFTLSGGTLTITDVVNSSAFNAAYTQSAGVLGGPATVVLNAPSTWSNGDMTGTGTTRVSSTLTLNSGNSKELIGRRLENAGTVILTSTGPFYLEDQAVFVNQVGAVFDAQSDADVQTFGTGPYTINNFGTLRKSGGTNETRIDPEVNNSGLVESQAGTLALNGGGTSSGSFTAGAAGTVDFRGGTHALALASGKTIGGNGTIEFSGGSTTISGPGTYDVAGTTSVVGGTVNFNLPARSQTTSVAGGTLGGTGTYTVAGTLAWTNGEMAGTGTTQILAGATATLSTGNQKELVGRTFANSGTTILTGTGPFYIEEQAVFANQVGGVLDIQSDADILTFGTGPYKLNNLGTLQKSGGTSESFINAEVNNTGLVRGQSGSLVLNGGGTSSGSYTTDPAGMLDFRAGTHTIALAAGQSIGGTGTIRVSGGSTTIAGPGTYDVPGTTQISGGTVNFNLPARSVTTTLDGGTLGGTGVYTVATTLTWSNGEMTGTGTTQVLATATATLNSGNQKELIGRTYVNLGTTNLTGTGPFYIEDQAEFVNQTSGLFNFQSDADILTFGTAPYTFTNMGTLRKSGGASESFINAEVNNSGLVEGNSGSLVLNGGGTSSGSYTTSAAGTVDFRTGTHTIALAAGESIGGTGTIEFTGGSTTITGPGTYDVPGTTHVGGNSVVNFNLPARSEFTTIDGGTLGGTGVFTVADTLTWSNGAMAGTGTTQLLAAAVATINSGNQKELIGRTFANAGATTITGTGPFYIEDQAVFLNLAGADLDFQSDADILTFGTGPFTINNLGRIRKLGGAGESFINAEVNNDGLVEGLSGSLVLNGGGTSTGSYAANTGGTVDFRNGTHTITLGNGQSVSGTGTIKVSGGTTTISGPGTYDLAGTTLLIGGVINFNLPARSQATTLDGGTLGGVGTYTVVGTLSWNNGDMSGTGTTVVSATATATLTSGNQKELIGRTFSNAGTTNLASTGPFYIENQAVFINQANALFNIQGDADILTFGTGPFTFNNLGTLRKSGGTGESRIDAAVNNDGVIDVQTGTLTLHGGGTSGGSFDAALNTILRFTAVHTLNAGASLNGAGQFTFTDNLIWFGGVQTGTGQTNIPTGATLTLRGTVNLQSALTGSGTLSVQGQSVVIASNNNTFNGQTRVSSGKLLVNGNLSGAVEVQDGATLGGSGQVGPVVVKRGGQLNPGNSPGILTVANGVRFEADAINVVELLPDIDAYIPGVGFDQALIQGGDVDLTGQPELRINVVGNVRSIPNNSLVIFDNRTASGIRGNFRGLGEGAVFDLDHQGMLYRITYKGGDGNDVVLTQVTFNAQIVLTVSAPSVGQDQALSLIATVSALDANLPRGPRGTVLLQDASAGRGQATLQSGQAGFVLGAGTLAPGQYSFRAVYQGDSNFQQTSSAFVPVLIQPGSGGGAAGQLALSGVSFTVSEADGTLVITIVRSGGTAGAVAVDYTIAVPDALKQRQKATPGVDFTAPLTATVAFGPGETSKSLNIAITPDDLVEDDEVFTIGLANPTGGAVLGTPAGASVVIRDDDLPSVGNRAVSSQVLESAAQGFGKSEEHYRDFVQKAYARFLNRAPDEQGFQYWVSLMKLYEDSKHTAGLRQENIEAGFLNSVEYKSRYGGIGEAWIRGIYKDLLSREGEKGGIDFWMTALANGGTPAQVALGFTASEERLRNRVGDTYQTLLDRAADNAGLEYWVALFKSGFTTEDIVSGFVGSPEYYNKPDRGAGNPANWVRSAYLDVLFRPAARSEFTYWLAVLDQG